MFKFISEEHPEAAKNFQNRFERQRKSVYKTRNIQDPDKTLESDKKFLQCGQHMLTSDSNTIKQLKDLHTTLQHQLEDLKSSIQLSEYMVKHKITIVSKGT